MSPEVLPRKACRLFPDNSLKIHEIGETFGLVVLEGIAAGCTAIGSNHGGVPEAVGPCGALFPAGNIDALAELLINPPVIPGFDRLAEEHLAPFHPRKVAQEYLELFERALSRR